MLALDGQLTMRETTCVENSAVAAQQRTTR